MDWQRKALIQRLVALLPESLGERVYYRIQRVAGAFRSIEPWEQLEAARQMAEAATRHGRPIAGAEILEVGTGHRVLIPIALWLLGAKRVATVDVHRYLKNELVLEDLDQMIRDLERVNAALSWPGGEVWVDRLGFLRRRTYSTVEELLGNLNIEYRAPGDAGDLEDDMHTYDLHVSRSVLEHVPPKELERILSESKRILRPSGILVHLVDFSDHFAHGSPSISSINFLRFSERQWHRLAGNQFAFHNRLRSIDFERLFQDSGFTRLESITTLDERAFGELEKGFPIHAQFREYDLRDLAHREGLFVFRPIGQGLANSN